MFLSVFGFVPAQNLVISRCCFAEDVQKYVQRILMHVHSHYSAY